MEHLRRYELMPYFQYKGQVITAFLYFKGNSDLVHSWDIIMGPHNLSKMMPDDLRALGFNEFDLDIINDRVASYVNHKEGR